MYPLQCYRATGDGMVYTSFESVYSILTTKLGAGAA